MGRGRTAHRNERESVCYYSTTTSSSSFPGRVKPIEKGTWEKNTKEEEEGKEITSDPWKRHTCYK